MGVKIVKKKKTVESLVLKNEEEAVRVRENINNLEINGFVPKIKTVEKRTNSVGMGMANNRSKDKHFRIMKKTVMERRN